jgi:hypothetical protein
MECNTHIHICLVENLSTLLKSSPTSPRVSLAVYYPLFMSTTPNVTRHCQHSLTALLPMGRLSLLTLLV